MHSVSSAKIDKSTRAPRRNPTQEGPYMLIYNAYQSIVTHSQNIRLRTVHVTNPLPPRGNDYNIKQTESCRREEILHSAEPETTATYIVFHCRVDACLRQNRYGRVKEGLATGKRKPWKRRRTILGNECVLRFAKH